MFRRFIETLQSKLLWRLLSENFREQGIWYGLAKAKGDMGFAGSVGAEVVMSKTCLRHEDILAPINPSAARQFQHLHLVQGRDRLEVEAISVAS